MHLKPTDLDVLNQEILLLFKQTLPAVVTLISFSSPQTCLCKHAGSSNSINVKQQRQKSSLYKWETPLTELQHSRLGGKCYYGSTHQQFSLIMEQTHQTVKQLLPS